ncbi:MAG: response regulator [Desulfobacteraceae bacterium]|nr:response regulator [Desulfobacteraceae bacterium]
MKPNPSKNHKNHDVNLSDMKLHFATLSFKDGKGLLEKEFLDDYYHKFINQVRISLFIAILFYSVFGILDANLMPTMRHQLWFIRYVVFFPLATLVLVWSFFKTYKKYMQTALSFVVVLAGTGIVTMIIIAPPPINYSYYAGLMLIFIFGYSFIRARFVWASITGWFVVFCYEIGAIVISDTPLPILINNNFFFISANIIGMFSCYSIEYAARRDFFLARLLVEEREKTDDANQKLEQRVKERTDMLANANIDLKQEIVERKRVEQELREIHNKLELRVEERTQALRQMHDDLENRVEERTEELKRTNIELLKAKEMADESTREKSNFLANMSHEIRTPMNAIIGMTDLALNPEIRNQKRMEYLSIINSSGTSLLGIINEILDFSKIEAGKLEIESTAFELISIVNNVSDLFIDDMRKNNIELVIDMEFDIPDTLIGDPLRLQQVITNLISNALKFTEKGTICIRVKKLNETDTDIRLSFHVNDTGIGIEKEILKKLFVAFSQADTSTTRKYGGTGLGLTICHKLVQMMNGVINIKSKPGKGSQFSFKLDFKKTQPARQNSLKLPTAVQNKPVLVAEDNALTREVLKKQLHFFGMLPTFVETGKQVIETHSRSMLSTPFELVIVDNDLPDMSGQAIAEQVWYVSENRPVIIMDDWKTLEKKFSPSNTAKLCHIQKPLRTSVLLETIMTTFGYINEKTLQFDPGNVNVTFHPSKILLVEDNHINQIVATEILSYAGLGVKIANNGSEAVEAIKNEKFDVVLMDVQMPVMDGLTATRLIRKDPVYKNLPIIAMTAHAIHGDKEKCIAAGMNHYISKPIDKSILYQILKNYLKEKKGKARTSKVVFEDIEKKHAASLEIAGVRVKKGMSRIGCNFKRYIEIISQFIKDFESVITQIRDAIAQNNLKVAKERNHTLKGAAGNLSIEVLHFLSQTLEQAIIGKDTDKINHTQLRLEGEFSTLCVSIQNIMAKSPAHAENKKPDQSYEPQETIKILDKLDKGLEACNPVETKTRFEQLKEYVNLTNNNVYLLQFSEDMENYIKGYQFDNARKLIKSFIHQTEKTAL